MHPRTSILCLALLIVAVLGTGAPAEAAPRTFTVTTTVDRPDRQQGDGTCAITGGGCSLRAALDEANANVGADTIVLPAGVHELEIPTLNEDVPGTGDLDVTDAVTINGMGAGLSIVDGGFPLPGASPEQRGLDRLLEIHRGAGNVTLSGVTLREGYSEEDGGAIQNWSTATLRIEDSEVLD
jgi:CSLREA domain-containing protein